MSIAIAYGMYDTIHVFAIAVVVCFSIWPDTLRILVRKNLLVVERDYSIQSKDTKIIINFQK